MGCWDKGSRLTLDFTLPMKPLRGFTATAIASALCQLKALDFLLRLLQPNVGHKEPH